MTRRGLGLLGVTLASALAPAGLLAQATASARTTHRTQHRTTHRVPQRPLPARSPTPVLGKAAQPVGSPAAGQLKLSMSGIFHVNFRPVTVAGRAVRVNGVMRPYVPGQLVTVHAFIGRRMIHSELVRVARSRGGTYGHFSVRFASPRAGPVFVSAVHATSPALARLVAYSGFAALDENIGPGSTGRFVQLIQGRLYLLHFYAPQTGVYDNGTSLAIDAYHRLRGWGTSQSLDGATIAGLLNEVGRFHIRYPGDGRHAEGNLSNQLLALANGSRVYAIYPISSGKPSTPTVLGHFNVYDKRPGLAPDGMYYSSFFIGGYAIHGYDPAPDYPASHGCLRVPIQDATSIYGWLDYGNAVDVYN